MKMVYVAGKFSAKTRDGVEANIAAAVSCSLEVAKAGGFPVCPHANTAHPDFERVQPYPFWIEGTLLLMLACDALFMVPGWEQSSGARGERERAIAEGMHVFDSIDALKAWLAGQS
jgi:hypothetical protein